MESTLVLNVEAAEDKKAKELKEDTVMKKTKEFVRIGLEVLREVRHQWEEAEKKY
ncbi:MAG: hypothetical protein JSV26_06555 [bacterium]|nr:MAG: hypothetical protein JSV26_06555 [bacterium]